MKNGPNYNSDFATTGTEEKCPDTERVPVPEYAEYVRRTAREMPPPETAPPGQLEDPPSDRMFVTDDMSVR